MKTKNVKGYVCIAVLAGMFLAGGCTEQNAAIEESKMQSEDSRGETASKKPVSKTEEIAGPVFDAEAAKALRVTVTPTPEPTPVPVETPVPVHTVTPESTVTPEAEADPVPTDIPKTGDDGQDEGTISKPGHPDAVSHDKLIFIGDSRTEGIRDAVGDDSIWSCLSSMGYNWMVSTGVPQIENEIEDNTAVIILMGVNDVYQLSNYITYINTKANEWADLGAKTYFVSVGPVQSDPYVTNREIENFNASMEANLVGVTYIDVYSYLMSNGFSTVDGIHYPDSVSIEIYNYILEHLEESRSGIWG